MKHAYRHRVLYLVQLLELLIELPEVHDAIAASK